ncbi:MAG: tail fiber protein [Desulfobacteraceae bacterium]|nr:tail fiber protein [Desulfobacteraceae bacterium]
MKPKVYIIYADVWERTVTHLMDERLRDKGLHGADTCTRKQTMAQVKWCPEKVDPEISDKNPSKGDAKLSLKLHQKTIEPDPCDPCAAQLDVESKTGNYLFRVEVHDVKGDADGPTEITLKWSSENGAEQFEAQQEKEEMPAGFINGKWVYEFFNMTSEKHLGVHFGKSPWQPARGVLKEIKEPSSSYDVPTIPGSRNNQTFVRRWDGYCILNPRNKTFKRGMDRGIVLSTSKPPKALGCVRIDSSSLHIKLSSINLDMVLDAKKFVAGDYWLADVREAEHDLLDTEKSKLIENELPHGIEHHYLTLGTVINGVLKSNPEADRKYAFPPLTEMTRMFMAGGDGQEVVPGEALPQPLRVGVANGEWPVAGASVRFQAVAADESLTLLDVVETNSDGIAKYVWATDAAIDAFLKVKATLVDPDDSDNDLDHPPVYFNANLVSADQVAYEPKCPVLGENAVHSHLVTDNELDLGENAYYTVKEVLDALLCKLRAKHIPYDDPNCDSASVTVKFLLSELGLDFDNDEHITVSDVLDTLLCKLRAKHIPYDPTLTANRWEDINEASANLPNNVQNAIDQLVNNLEASDILYELPPCETTNYGVSTFKKLIEENIEIEAGETNPKIKAVWDAVLCFLDANHIPYDPTQKPERWEDINEENEGGPQKPETVQEALDNLVENLESSDIRYTFRDDCAVVQPYGAKSLNIYLLEILRELAGDPALETVKTKDLWDALLCHLDAAKLPYNPNESSMTTARWKDITEQSGTGDLSEPNTVQEAIDELIKWLESTDIRYEVPNCGEDESPTVRSLLQISPGQSKVDDILDQLLCYFNATDLPLDKTSSRLCNELKLRENVKSVQDAIEFLCNMNQVSCAVSVSSEDSLEDIFSKFIESEDKTIHLRLQPGIHTVEILSVIDEHEKDLIALTGCGAEFTTLEFVNELRFYAKHVILKNIKIITVDTGSIFLKAQDIDIDNCEFLRYGGEESAQAFISVEEIASEIGDGTEMLISSTLNWKQSDVSVYVSNSTYLPGSDKSIITAIGDVPASATSTWNKLADFLSASYKADNLDYVKSTRAIAKEILEIPIEDRKTIYKARPLDNINSLPGRSVALRSLGSLTSDISASTATSITSLGIQLNNKKTQGTEKELVESYYSVLNSAEYTEAHEATLADLLSNLAEAVFSAPGTALALSSTAINGTISDSSIWGKLAMFSNHQNEIQLKDRGSINSIEKGLDYLSGSGSLKLEANYLREVVSNIQSDSFDEQTRKIVKATSAYYQLQLIDNTIVSGASFFANNIIMTGNKLVDRTPSSQETGVAALVLCYDGVFNANSAVNSEAKIQRISLSKVQSANHINFLDLYDPDGTHVQVLGNGEETPAGTIMAYSSDRIPDNWLECNGYQYDRVRYAALFAAIGIQFGAGDGLTTFNIPDLRGEFIRGLDHEGNVDPDTGRVIGSSQVDQIQDHFHKYNDSTAYNPVKAYSVFMDQTALSEVSDQERDSGPAMVARTGTETRPRNVALMYCIKY